MHLLILILNMYLLFGNGNEYGNRRTEKGKYKYMILNRETVTCAKNCDDCLLKNNKSAASAKIAL